MDEKEIDLQEEVKKELDADELSDSVRQVADASSKYVEASLQKKRMETEYRKITGLIKGDIPLIEHRLEEYLSLEELQSELRNDETIESFFINDDGSEMRISDQEKLSKRDLLDMKKNLLLVMKQTELTRESLSQMMEDFNQERESIERDMKKTASDIVIDTLRYAIEAKKSPKYTDGSVEYKKKIDAILSGFDFGVIIKTMHEHPTIVPNTLHDMKTNDRVVGFGERYRATLKKAGSAASLITFVSNSPDTSFEKMYLPPDKYKDGQQNLFLFSIIRFFVMEYWTTHTKKTHAMMVSLLQQLTDDTLPEDLKEQFIENISLYLKEFNQ